MMFFLHVITFVVLLVLTLSPCYCIFLFFRALNGFKRWFKDDGLINVC